MQQLKIILRIALTIALFLSCSENPTLNPLTQDVKSNNDLNSILQKDNPFLKDLISWWPGDGDAADIIGGYDGNLMNGTGFGDGIVGSAFKFDWEGSNNYEANYVEIEEIKRVDNLQKFTMEMWVKLENVDGALANRIERFMTIAPGNIEKASLRHDGGGGSVNDLHAGRLHFFMRIDGVFQHVNAPDVLKYKEFKHVAATYDGKIMRLYCDGEEVGSTPFKGFVAQGDSKVYLSSPEEPISGLIDEAKIYKKALSADEIKLIYDEGIRVE